MNCHVAPASVDLNTPLPEYDERALSLRARAHPDDAGIRGRDGDGAHGGDADAV